MKTIKKNFSNLCFNAILFILIVFCLTACEKVIDLPLKTSELQLVIEGNINNLDTVQFVRLTRTKKYFSSNIFEGVRGATVILTEVLKDGRKTIDTLEVTERDGECIGCFGGYYASKKIQKCTPGASYRLDVINEGKKYYATTRMQEVVNLDSISYHYRKSDPPRIKEGYYTVMHGKEPDTIGNYYRTIVYKNDSIYKIKEMPDYLVTDDLVINGLPIKNELIFPFKENDKVRIDLLAIDGVTYRLYYTLLNEIFAGGNPFAPPGDNIVTNIRGDKAFGFFGSFSICRMELVIKKKK